MTSVDRVIGGKLKYIFLTPDRTIVRNADPMFLLLDFNFFLQNGNIMENEPAKKRSRDQRSEAKVHHSRQWKKTAGLMRVRKRC